MTDYPIIDISSQDIDDFESMGTKSKFWYTDSQTSEKFLFKSIHTEDRHGNPIERKGENWAEKIACELAHLLGIPHAHYELAKHKNEYGIRSEKFTVPGDNMFFGNQLIAHVSKSVNSTLEKGERSQTVERVAIILDRLISNPPKDWVKTENIKTALDVFIGYLMLDVLLSNQDRHSENWAMIVNDNQFFLAPSFDHAASLGRNESVQEMNERLTSKDKARQIVTYVTKSKSHFYRDAKRLKALDAFLAFGSYGKKATLAWLERLEALEDEQMQSIIDRVPGSIMGTIEKAFCMSLLMANKNRILNCKNTFIENEVRKETAS